MFTEACVPIKRKLHYIRYSASNISFSNKPQKKKKSNCEHYILTLGMGCLALVLFMQVKILGILLACLHGEVVMAHFGLIVHDFCKFSSMLFWTFTTKRVLIKFEGNLSSLWLNWGPIVQMVEGDKVRDIVRDNVRLRTIILKASQDAKWRDTLIVATHLEQGTMHSMRRHFRRSMVYLDMAKTWDFAFNLLYSRLKNDIVLFWTLNYLHFLKGKTTLFLLIYFKVTNVKHVASFLIKRKKEETETQPIPTSKQCYMNKGNILVMI